MPVFFFVRPCAIAFRLPLRPHADTPPPHGCRMEERRLYNGTCCRACSAAPPLRRGLAASPQAANALSPHTPDQARNSGTLRAARRALGTCAAPPLARAECAPSSLIARTTVAVALASRRPPPSPSARPSSPIAKTSFSCCLRRRRSWSRRSPRGTSPAMRTVACPSRCCASGATLPHAVPALRRTLCLPAPSPHPGIAPPQL